MNMQTTVAVRSILLRGFDRQCAEKVRARASSYAYRTSTSCTVRERVCAYISACTSQYMRVQIGQMMECYGTRFYHGVLPKEIAKQANGKLLVSYILSVCMHMDRG